MGRVNHWLYLINRSVSNLLSESLFLLDVSTKPLRLKSCSAGALDGVGVLYLKKMFFMFANWCRICIGWPQVVHDFLFCREGLLWVCLKREKVQLTLAGKGDGHTGRALCCRSSCVALCCQKPLYLLPPTFIAQPLEFEFWKTDSCKKGIFVVQHTSKTSLDSLKNIIDVFMPIRPTIYYVIELLANHS